MLDTSQMRGRKAENALWDLHRKRIENLYLDLNKTLGDVKEIMATTYSFDRTIAQYERVFRKWKLRKNFKAKELKSIKHQITKREAQGKKSSISIDGRMAKIDKSKIEKRASRHNYETTLERLHKVIQGPESPGCLPGIIISTPPAIDELFLPTVNLP